MTDYCTYICPYRKLNLVHRVTRYAITTTTILGPNHSHRKPFRQSRSRLPHTRPIVTCRQTPSPNHAAPFHPTSLATSFATTRPTAPKSLKLNWVLTAGGSAKTSSASESMRAIARMQLAEGGGKCICKRVTIPGMASAGICWRRGANFVLICFALGSLNEMPSFILPTHLLCQL